MYWLTSIVNVGAWFFVARLPHSLFPHGICMNVNDDLTPEDLTRDHTLPDDDNQPRGI